MCRPLHYNFIKSRRTLARLWQKFTLNFLFISPSLTEYTAAASGCIPPGMRGKSLRNRQNRSIGRLHSAGHRRLKAASRLIAASAKYSDAPSYRPAHRTSAKDDTC